MYYRQRYRNQCFCVCACISWGFIKVKFATHTDKCVNKCILYLIISFPFFFHVVLLFVGVCILAKTNYNDDINPSSRQNKMKKFCVCIHLSVLHEIAKPTTFSSAFILSLNLVVCMFVCTKLHNSASIHKF